MRRRKTILSVLMLCALMVLQAVPVSALEVDTPSADNTGTEVTDDKTVANEETATDTKDAVATTDKVAQAIPTTAKAVTSKSATPKSDDGLTDDQRAKFYDYTLLSEGTYKGTYKVGLTSDFKTQLNKATGGEFTADGYTWKTGDPLPNPCPDGKYKGIAVTSMRQMFYNDTSTLLNMTTLDLSNFDTSNVTNMEHMFNMCFNLTNLDLSSFDTSNVTSMHGMFMSSGLTNLDISSFDTSNVTSMRSMFSNCSDLTSLDVSNFDTSNVTNMENMFESCSSLTNLDVSNFDTSNVTNITFMFGRCESLSRLDLSNFDTSNVTNMSNCCSYCYSLTYVDISNFDLSKVSGPYGLFDRAGKLTDGEQPVGIAPNQTIANAFNNPAAWPMLYTTNIFFESAFKVTYNANDGKATTPTSKNFAKDTVVTVADNTFTAPTDKAFDGWNTKADGSGTAYKAGDKLPAITADVNLYAQWKDNTPVVEKFKVTYNANDGKTTAPIENEYDKDTVVTVADNTFTAPTDKTFDGWNTKADGSGTAYKAGDKLPAITADVNLYAQWKDNTPVVEKFRVTYNANDGKTTAPIENEYDKDTEVTVADNTFTAPTDKTFDGWNTKADGSGTAYKAGDKLPAITADVNLYAQWRINSIVKPVTNHKITVLNDGNGTAKADVTEAAQGTTINLTATPNDGYHFKEWTVVDKAKLSTQAEFFADKNNATTTFEMTDNDVSIRATFEKNDTTDSGTDTDKNNGGSSSSNNSSGSNGSNGPKTGDDSNMALWLTIVGLAGVTAAGLLKKRQSSNK